MTTPIAPSVAASPVILSGSRAGLPPRLRPDAALGVCHATALVTEPLVAKSRYVESRPDLRLVLAVPDRVDRIETGNGCRTYRLKGLRPSGGGLPPAARSQAALDRVVDHERPEVVTAESPWLIPWLTRFRGRRNAPLAVWQPRGIPASGIAQAVLRRGFRLLGERAPVTVCSSDWTAAALFELGVERIAKIPIGVDLETFTPDRRLHAADVRMGFGLPEGNLALVVARPGLGPKVRPILEAWEHVERRTRTQLVIAGMNRDEAPGYRYADRAIWIPSVPDRSAWADLVAAADFSVVPPGDGDAAAVLASLASGTPVLGSDQGEAAELVPRSVVGERYRDGDLESLIEGAVWLAKQNLRSLGLRSRSYVERHHGWDGVIERRFSVYARLAASRS